VNAVRVSLQLRVTGRLCFYWQKSEQWISHLRAHTERTSRKAGNYWKGGSWRADSATCLGSLKKPLVCKVRSTGKLTLTPVFTWIHSCCEMYPQQSYRSRVNDSLTTLRGQAAVPASVTNRRADWGVAPADAQARRQQQDQRVYRHVAGVVRYCQVPPLPVRLKPFVACSDRRALLPRRHMGAVSTQERAQSVGRAAVPCARLKALR
jgi:hypothetical protein